MTTDESPVDIAALGVAPPADNESLADTAAAPDATPSDTPSPSTRRRRPSPSEQPRARRAAKPVPPSPEPTEPEPLPVVETEAPVVEAVAPAEKPAGRRRSGTGARRKPAEPAVEPDVEPVVDPVAPPESAPAVLEQVAVADSGMIAVSPSAGGGPAVEKASRARRPSRKAAASTVDATVDSTVAEPEPAPEQAAVAETAPETVPEKPARSRRGGRSRRREAEPATQAEVPIETTAESTVQATAEAPGRVDEEAPAPDKARRNRRGGRTRAEKAAEPQEDLSRGGRIVVRRGVVELLINGEPVPPVIFFGNVEGEREARKVGGEVQRAAANGVHIHSTLVELTCPLPPDDTVYETFDSRIETLVDADPKGWFIPRIVFIPAPGWRRQYPNEVNHYADGSTDDPSIASNHFWMEAENALTALIEHVSRMTYGERIVGYHLERGEWFHPADGGYDRSFANREAFRAWLRSKYKNSEAALRAAWFDGAVQFYTADIPTLPTAPRPEIAFFEARKERRWIDFLEYTSEVTADRLIGLAKAVKAASQNRALVSVCYGYTFEFGHTFSGHLALGRMLESPAIDIIAGPPSYRDRQPGGAASFPGPVDSIPLHGKLWLSEDDTKTYLSPSGTSPDDFNPRIDSKWATEQVQKRAMGKSLVHRTAIAWMDTWGEGWLDSDEMWKSIGAFTGHYRDLLSSRKTWSPEVVVLVGEKSLLHVQKGESFVRRLLREQRDVLQQSGASIGFYLQSDVLSKAFPTDAKLYVFLTPYRIPAEHRAAIKEKLQQGGKTLVWMYAPAVCDARGEPEEGAHELVGITLRQQSWNSEVGSRIVDSRHIITEGIQGRNVGVRERLNPSFSVDDDGPGITVVGEYLPSGLPSIAVREMDGWKTVFCGEPTMSGDLFRGLCRFAGVHLYTQGSDDYVFAGDGWLTIHTTRDGNRTIHLPPSRDLYSLDDMKLASQNSSEYRAFMKGRTTYSFYVGTTDDMRKMGLPVERMTSRRRGRPEAAAPVESAPVETPGEPATAVETPSEAPETAGREALAANESLLLSEVAAPVDLDGLAAGEDDEESEENAGGTPAAEGTEEDAASSAEQRRRRRRRGGRGRGRRHRSGGNGQGAAPSPG